MVKRGTISESSGRRRRSVLFEPADEAPDNPTVEPDFIDAASPPSDDVESEQTMSDVTWDTEVPRKTIIKVLGIGGGGCNAVESMIDQGFEGVEFYAVNTDYQALQRCHVPNRVQIGENLTSGSGAGAVPSIGEQAAREAEDEIRDLLEGADMIFITAGLGGGTGTGAAPVIAEIARSMNILNVAIVTKPFHFEGTQRMRRAEEGCIKLAENVDTMISILNDKLMEVVGPKTPLTEAFQVANTVLAQGIRAISDLIAMPGLINVDFRDVRTTMGETGGAVMGVGIGKGENRAVEAVRKACHSPLQEKIVIDGARGILINITGPANITMLEINEATSLIYEMADPDANVIFGVVIDDSMNDAMRVTIIATGFGEGEEEAEFKAPSTDKLRARPNPLMSLPPEPEENISVASPETEEKSTMEPAILRKRRSSKLDFDSAENPLKEWEEKMEVELPETSEASETEEEPAVRETPKAAVFADSEPEGGQPSEEREGYVETPALHRRRRQRFFE